MHILFLTDNFPPEVNAPASRTFEHCREWVKIGNKVTVITCAPNFPKGKVFEGYRNWPWRSEEVEGIRVIRVWSYITPNEGFVRRILDYLSFMISAFIAALFVRRVDIIIGTSPQFFTVCAAFAASLIKRRPWIFELRDLWPDSIRAVGAIKKGQLLKFLERLELFLYRRATGVISVTYAFKQNLISRGIDEAKIFVVTNGVDVSRFRPIPKDSDIISQLGLDKSFVAGYIGTHGMAHGLDTLVDAAKVLASSPLTSHFRILMLGDGARRGKLKERARAEGLQNMLFVDSVAKDEVVRYWSILDVSIIHLKSSDVFRDVIPSKMFECMAMGIPIVHGVEGESADIVRRCDIGLTFPSESHLDLVRCLTILHDDVARRDRFVQNGPNAARQFDRRALAERMLDCVKVCLFRGLSEK